MGEPGARLQARLQRERGCREPQERQNCQAQEAKCQGARGPGLLGQHRFSFKTGTRGGLAAGLPPCGLPARPSVTWLPGSPGPESRPCPGCSHWLRAQQVQHCRGHGWLPSPCSRSPPPFSEGPSVPPSRVGPAAGSWVQAGGLWEQAASGCTPPACHALEELAKTGWLPPAGPLPSPPSLAPGPFIG